MKIIDLDKAFEEYEAVSMPPSDFSPTMPDPVPLEKRYNDQVGSLAKARYDFLRKALSEKLKKNIDDADLKVQLGIVEFQYGAADRASALFAEVLEKNPKNVAALNDLGGMAFVAGDYAGAERKFLAAAEIDGADGDLWLNLAKTAAKLKKAGKAREYGAKAVSLAPAYKPYVDGLINGL